MKIKRILRSVGLLPKKVREQPIFRTLHGLHYLDTLAAIHAAEKPSWYLEIGTETGKSLARAQCQVIAIDPEFKLKSLAPMSPQVHLFQTTSDAFFENDFLQRNGIKLDLSFIDGMHLFEFALRDFINCERHSKPEACITLHDCVPLNHIMADRNWDKSKTDSWTGDVWKLLPILREFRPDLSVKVLDAAPFGLVVVEGLSPASSVLKKKLPSIVKKWKDVKLSDYGSERLEAEFPLTPVSSYLGTTPKH